MFNEVTIVGNLGRDPESRDVGDDTVCNFNVATNEKWTDRSGNKKQRTTWFRVAVWGNAAKACQRYLSTGRLVMVKGKVSARAWVDKDGKEQASLEVRASPINGVTFLGGGDDDRSGGGNDAGYGTDSGKAAQDRWGNKSSSTSNPPASNEDESDEVPF